MRSTWPRQRRLLPLKRGLPACATSGDESERRWHGSGKGRAFAFGAELSALRQWLLRGDNLVVRGFGVVALKKLLSFLRDYGGFIVRSSHGANVGERIPKNNGNEFHLVANSSAQKVASGKSSDLA